MAVGRTIVDHDGGLAARPPVCHNVRVGGNGFAGLAQIMGDYAHNVLGRTVGATG